MLQSLSKFMLLGLIIVLGGCATTKVQRVPVEKQIDLSGDWNDVDATMTAQEMLRDCLARPWQPTFVGAKGRNPVIIIGHITNRTDEHINYQTFVQSLERELLNSGKATFVANPNERGEMRAEREDQKQGFTDTATMAAVGKERGADYMLIGSINSIKDEVGKKAVNFYQVNLELVDLSTNEKVWIGQQEIKKFVKRSKVSL
jgi:uncharacterized protein (TIGR02722 family)